MDYLRSIYFILFLKKEYKWLLMADYLRLLFTSWLQYNFNRKPIHNTTFLDYQIKFPQLSSLLFLIQEIFIYECYKNPESKPKKIIDVGSHIGLSVLFFHIHNPKTMIEAYELNPSTFSYLKNNIETNHLHNIKIFNVGISNISGVQYLQTQLSDLNSSISLVPSPTEIVSLDINTIIDTPNTFLKLDVEGHENILIEQLCTSKNLNFINQLVVETDKTNSIIQKTLNEKGFTKINHKNSFYKNLPEEIQTYASD